MDEFRQLNAWNAKAACRGVSVNVMFPKPKDVHGIAFAKRWCARCPVTAECLGYALAGNEAGIWGATTSAERKVMRRDRRGAPAA